MAHRRADDIGTLVRLASDKASCHVWMINDLGQVHDLALPKAVATGFVIDQTDSWSNSV
jgi:hypothetical protein